MEAKRKKSFTEQGVMGCMSGAIEILSKLKTENKPLLRSTEIKNDLDKYSISRIVGIKTSLGHV